MRTLTGLDRERYARAAVTEQDFLAFASARAFVGEPGYAPHEQVGFRPTAEVNSLSAGYTGDGIKTIIPAEAQAVLSFRLVPDQDRAAVQNAVEKFVLTHTPEAVSAEVVWHGTGVAPFVVSMETPAYAALERALAEAFDNPVVAPTRAGGSGPEAALAEVLGAPMVSLASGSPRDRIHAPDERASISRLLRGAEAAALLWRELADLGRSGLAGETTDG